MSKVYLKTYFYVEHEIKFLIMNLMEAYHHVDHFIICEHNITHTGQPREFIFEEHKHKFPPELMDKVIYLPQDISFDNDDIIISVDADEIIYREAYDYILSEVNEKECVRLNLHQFFYKTNYLWEGKDFTSPIAAKYKVFRHHYPCNWRDVGPVVSKRVGCHFSWCMTPEEMVYKLHTYSHPRYRFCADEKLLKDAIENKKYPFDPSVDFNIRELDMNDEVLPECLRSQSQYLEKELV